MQKASAYCLRACAPMVRTCFLYAVLGWEWPRGTKEKMKPSLWLAYEISAISRRHKENYECWCPMRGEPVFLQSWLKKKLENIEICYIKSCPCWPEKTFVLCCIAFNKLLITLWWGLYRSLSRQLTQFSTWALGGDFLARFLKEGCWYGKCRLELALHTYLHATA